MTFVIHANLDQEARWAGAALPRRVKRKLAVLSTLLTALVDDDVVQVFGLEDVESWRLVAIPGWTHPRMLGEEPEHWDLAWAQPTAKVVNDRRFAASIARDAGWGLPGARTIASLIELDAHLAAGGAAASPTDRWVCKAPWSAAGRDRWIGVGAVIDQKTRGEIQRLLQRFGAVVFEPWLDRIVDVAVCATVDADGTVRADAPHRLITDPTFGQFVGVELESPLDVGEHDQLAIMVETVGKALSGAGFSGPFGVDAFVYRDGDSRRLHPLCEINARHTFGHVARALGRKVGIRALGFGPPPAGATILIQRGKNDATTAWVA